MKIYETTDYDSMSRKAAGIIFSHVTLRPDCVLGLATGSTPVGTYNQLSEWCKNGDLSFAETRSVNLDEYRGLAPDHPQSYRYFMQENLFGHIDIKRENTNVPDGLASDPDAECRRYNEVIRSMGGIDLQLLGLGHNGHIGFNEPDGSFQLETHLVDLTESTIRANTRFFNNEDEVPRQAFTMGIKNIMDARQVLVIVSGEAKADIVLRAFAGEVCPQIPASILQMHPNFTLIGDSAALSKLKAAGVEICK